MTARSLTSQELAKRIPLPRGCRGGAAYVERRCREDEAAGYVERDGGGWRITDVYARVVAALEYLTYGGTITAQGVLEDRFMGTSVEQIDRTYGHLLPDSIDRTRSAIDNYVAGSAPSSKSMRSD